ncbi:hypothetical protein SPHINGO391_510195 [Sphingomonas aurantiaca]|uniref:Uncharacterized protein n=1 Tax=Sphingomonas aurantiaca TaxID=185949 RepID=A0A5E8AKB9_9SPHN|nr:hypothetical protein SPHINGO391_510195 [Sphingomonas aurantiaca]
MRRGRHSGSSGCHLSLIQFGPVRSTSPPVGVGHQPLEKRLVAAKPMPVGVGRRTHDRARERVIHANRRARVRCSIEFHEEYGQPLRSGEAGAGRRGPAPAALQGAGRWDQCLFRDPVACDRRVHLEFGILAREADLGLDGVPGPQRNLRHSLALEGRPERSFQVDLACSVIADRGRHAGPLRSICPDDGQKRCNPHISEFSREW